jgi:hypothetical protein
VINLDLALARALSAALDEAIEAKRAQIEEGFCTEFSQYREAVGELRAYRAAKSMLEDTLHRLMNDRPDNKR